MSKKALTKAKKLNKGHHWNTFKKVRNYLHKLLQFKHNQFNTDLPETLKENPKRLWSYCRSKTKKYIHRKNCHEGLSATNPNDMTCMFNKYFELASNNNTGESLAFVVAERAFKVVMITSSVAKLIFLCCGQDHLCSG